jgi:hypothetical protein
MLGNERFSEGDDLMARIRTIKPEFWTNSQVMDCSTNSRLLFIGLWNFCDDAGRHELSPKKIKAEIFPSDDFLVADVQGMIDELESNGLIVTYDFDNKGYLFITGWKHQKIDKPQKPRCPPPPNDGSENVRRKVATERIGKDRILGKDLERKNNNSPAQHSRTRAIDESQIPIVVDENQSERPAPAAAPGRSELDLVENACRSALSEKAPCDLVIGPMVEIVRKFGQERVSLCLQSEARRARHIPVKSWKLWAKIVGESLELSPKNTVVLPEESVETITFLNGQKYPKWLVLKYVEDWNAGKPWGLYGEMRPYGHKCQIPPEYLEKCKKPEEIPEHIEWKKAVLAARNAEAFA